MGFKKIEYKKWLNFFGRIIISGFVVLYLFLAPFTLLPSLLSAQANVNKSENYEYQGILELWHIETFEGGAKSRSGFLEREAINFEKKHKGTYIVIQTMNLEQFELNIKQNKHPNIISFGIGVGNDFVENLLDLDCASLRGDICAGGVFNGKQKAVPYILGGYAIISNGNANGKTGVGLKGTTNPLLAVQKEDKQIAELYDDNSLDSYDAYDKFIKGNFSTLIGTQRDVFRCKSRMDKGLLNGASFTFLNKYTDLVQYLSVFKGKEIEEKLCNEFVSHMISSNVQAKLKDYNLFSTLTNIKLYTDGLYKDFEDSLQSKLTIENVFEDISQIQTKKDEAFKNVVKK
ncbi:MAG TPA: hypothetical protein DCO89_00895 [Clostridiales bacterium]|nr:hypothetical protein [Clostridiales bacterium]